MKSIDKMDGIAIAGQVKRVIAQVNEGTGRTTIVGHQHRTRLVDLHPDSAYFFSIRDPVTRFVSGFYSRRRQGGAKKLKPWNQGEEEVFARYEHANDLAEALFADGSAGRDAAAAILTIFHTAQNQVAWFAGSNLFLTHRPPVWIVRQENFEADLQEFFRRAGLEHLHASIEVTADDVLRHATDYGAIPPLSDEGRANVEAWYAQDRAFYQMCSAWLDERRDVL